MCLPIRSRHRHVHTRMPTRTQTPTCPHDSVWHVQTHVRVNDTIGLRRALFVDKSCNVQPETRKVKN